MKCRTHHRMLSTSAVLQGQYISLSPTRATIFAQTENKALISAGCLIGQSKVNKFLATRVSIFERLSDWPRDKSSKESTPGLCHLKFFVLLTRSLKFLLFDIRSTKVSHDIVCFFSEVKCLYKCFVNVIILLKYSFVYLQDLLVERCHNQYILKYY